MKTVDAAFIKAEIASYCAFDDTLTVHVVMNDGRQRTFAKELKIEDPEQQAMQLFKDVMQRLKAGHASDQDDFLSGIVSIRFKPDEDALIEQLAKFLATASAKSSSLKRQGLSRHDVERKMTGLCTARA